MRALNIAVFMWILGASIAVVTEALGGSASVTTPIPGSWLEQFLRVPGWVGLVIDATAIGFAVLLIKGEKFNGLIGLATVYAILMGLGVLGRLLWYAVMIGSSLDSLVYGSLGVHLPSSLVTLLNGFGVLVSVMGVVSWWRGTGGMEY